MEFFDEDRPTRFVLKSRPSSSHNTDDEEEPKTPNKIFISICITISILLLSLSFLYFESEPSQSLLLWLSLSILIGPFAPSSLTGGKIRVGYGPILEPNQIDDQSTDNNERKKKRSNKGTKNDNPQENVSSVRKVDPIVNGSVTESNDWSKEDIAILKKQLIKHPVGKAGRWEAVAFAFGGKYMTENVIKKAKEIGEKKVYESDDYVQFLKNRKGSDRRLGEDDGGDEEGGKESWSKEEDIALLNALKVFPKEVDMRWEKVAGAVPGKTKAVCMKRVTELKKGFRSSKSGTN